MNVSIEGLNGKPATNGLRPVIEACLWGMLGLAVSCAMLALRPSQLSNDSYQYLDVAANIRHGNGVATDLVYFDTERSHGRIPAPLTTFPPGYPAAVAALSGFVGGLEAAARMVSAVCFGGTAALLATVLIAAGVNRLVRAAVLLMFVANVVSGDFSDAVLTESMFVFIFTAAIVALLYAWRGLESSRSRLAWTVTGLTLAGLSYWVRYAGLFLIVAVVLCVVLRFFGSRHRERAWELCATVIPIALASLLMARNVLLVGTWKGGNGLQVSHPLRGVLADYARAQLHLLLGEHAVKFGLWEGLLLVGGLGLGALLTRLLLLSGSGGATVPSWIYSVWTLPFICTAVYSAGICYAGLHTVISFGTRMFLPVLPLYLLLIGLALHRLISRAQLGGGTVWFGAALLALVIGYIGVNARDLSGPQPETRQAYLSTLFAERTADGQSLSDWVRGHIAPTAVVAAQDGQATGYLLQRPTLGLVESEYSSERWECDEIKQQMNRFGARYLILYRNPDHNSHLLEESRFAAAASSGEPGCGFAVVSENADVRILKTEPPTGASGATLQ